MPRQHVADRAADAIAEWLERTSEMVAQELLGSPYAPEVVTPTRAQALAFFDPLFFLPDGSPNEPGRQQVIDQYGADAFEEIATEFARDLRRAGEEVG